MYDLRSKLYEELEKYVAEKDRTELSKELNDTENWLYEEGDDCIKQVYLDRLDLLKVRDDCYSFIYSIYTNTIIYSICIEQVYLDRLDLLKVRDDYWFIVILWILFYF